MPYTISAEPHFSMPKPDDWDSLSTFSECLIDPNEPYSDQSVAVDGLWNALRLLGDDPYDHNRYYGTGLVIQRLFGTLSTQEAQDAVIKQTTSEVVRKHKEYSEDRGIDAAHGLYLNEISGGHTTYGFMQRTNAMDAAYKRMAPGTRLLINSLIIGGLSPDGVRDNVLLRYSVNRILEDQRAMTQVTHDTFANTGSLLRAALLQRYETEHNDGKPLSDEQTWPILVSDIATPEEIAGLRLIRTAAVGAGQRLDRFRGLMIAHLQGEENGIAFDPDAVKEPLGPVQQVPDSSGVRRVTHNMLIRCPALAVAGVIPFAAQAMPKVISKAQERILYR